MQTHTWPTARQTTRPARTLAALALAACALPMASQAQDAPVLPFGTLSYTAPTGTASATEVIDVWLQLQIDINSPALDFSSYPLAGIDPALVPTQGYFYPGNGDPRELRDFASVDGAYLNVYAGCSGSFIGDCSPGSSDYSFNFNYGPASVIGLDHISLAPGATLDYMLGSFTPKAGGAAPGSYSFSITGLTLSFFGVDGNNSALFADGLTLASECAGCEFTRTVTAVPEPGTWALWLAGGAAVAGVARRRRLQLA